MAKNKPNKRAKSDYVPNPNEASAVTGEQRVEIIPTFVVTRGDCRVSESEYDSVEAPKAIEERNFWQRIVDKYPDGTKVEIVPFDKKKHRIW